MNEVKFYYVYLITNLILNKLYVGSKICYKEDPNNDDYWGSSKYLSKDYEIFGKENFSKKIIKKDYANIKDMLDGESYYILKYNTLTPYGYNRYVPNQHPGFHTGGIALSEEHKNKISQSNKGRSLSKEHKKKISKSLHGHLIDKTVKDKISKTLSKGGPYFCKECGKRLHIKGKYCLCIKCYRNTNQYKNNLINLTKNSIGKKQSDETKEKRRKSMLGKNKGKQSPFKGIPRTEEVKNKIRNANKGKKVSEETKKKLSDSHKGQIPWNKGMKFKK
jgi:hypothetical protein